MVVVGGVLGCGCFGGVVVGVSVFWGGVGVLWACGRVCGRFLGVVVVVVVVVV